MNSNKRQCLSTEVNDDTSAWEKAKQYIIHRQGGYIHERLTFDTAERTIKVRDGGDNGGDHSGGSDTTSTTAISKGTILMKLPTTVLITLHTAEKSIYGPSLFQLFSELEEKDKDSDATDLKLSHPKNDLLLALFLSLVVMNTPTSCTSTSPCTNTSTSNDKQKEQHEEMMKIVQLYLATLPTNESYNNLPRRWDETKLTKYLTGTRVLKRIKEDQYGLKRDYEIISNKVLHQNTNAKMKDILSPFPPFEVFDQMIAAVESRAFQGLGDDQLDAMIPLLDLLNHKRGSYSHGDAGRSDISYHRSEGTCDADINDNSNANKSGGGNSSFIVVTAKCELQSGSIPGITYGAKGNAILLSRYGFTLTDNIEPDGSSNDILEFCPNLPNGQVIELKRGPKAYTYGCFVKALDFFFEEKNRFSDKNENHDVSTGTSNMGDNDKGFYSSTGANDDMEAFLNACDENDYGEGEDCMMNLYCDGGGDGDGDDGGGEMMDLSGNMGIDDNNEYNNSDNNDDDTMILREMKALTQFIITLGKARNEYNSVYNSNKDIDVEKKKRSEENTSTNTNTNISLYEESCERYSAILVQSERQTLYLYELAARLLRAKLESNKKGMVALDDHTEDKSISNDVQNEIELMFGEGPGKLVQKQAIELSEAYCRIRHESLL